jgi:SAM-dependent methyltransferase
VQRDGFLAFAPALAGQNDGFNPTAFAGLAEVEARNFWFRARNRLLAWALRRYFPRAESFLEIGCGTGFVLSNLRREFPVLRFSGSEICTEGLAFAQARLPGAALFQMDARNIPYVDEFDVVGAFDVLEHIEDDEAVLRQMHRAVRDGGGILLTVPQHRVLWSAFDEYARHKRRYARRELLSKVRGAGFTPLRVGSFNAVLLPLMLLSRLRNRRLTAGYDAVDELRMGALANTLLGAALAGERALIQAGVRFPRGGSLFVVAAKTGRQGATSRTP